MIKNYTPAQYYTKVDYDVVFDDGCNNGWSFPCDENGNLLPTVNPIAVKNYKECLKYPHKFVRFDKVIKREYRVKDDAHGTCHCGNEVYLYNEYHGACQCEKCGQWYNLFGQELLPPDGWEEALDYDY